MVLNGVVRCGLRMMPRRAFHREPFQPTKRTPVWVSAEEALQHRVKSGDRIYVQGFSATPGILLDSLYDYAQRRALHNLTLFHLVLEGNPMWATGGDTSDMMVPQPRGLRSNCLFVGRNMRESVAAGTADYIPIFLSEVPRFLSQTNLDLAIIQVSPPDEKGFCTLGTSVDVTRAALCHAKKIVALSNPSMPRTFGDGIIHISNIDVMVYGDYPLPERAKVEVTEVEERVGANVAALVKDRATVQLGMGAIPTATARHLRNHKGLGIHTEAFTDEVMELVHSGAVTNEHKKVHQGKLVGSVVFGSKALYNWIHDNPLVYLGNIEWVNEPSVIQKNPRVTAINSAIEIDLSGQVAADSFGHRIISGVGGQVDFMRGAARSVDGEGMPIIAMCSTTRTGDSKIVGQLAPGAGVVTSRAHADYVVTEHGVASLFGKNLRQRAAALIAIAHPDQRGKLEKEAYAQLKQMPSLS